MDQKASREQPAPAEHFHYNLDRDYGAGWAPVARVPAAGPPCPAERPALPERHRPPGPAAKALTAIIRRIRRRAGIVPAGPDLEP